MLSGIQVAEKIMARSVGDSGEVSTFDLDETSREMFAGFGFDDMTGYVSVRHGFRKSRIGRDCGDNRCSRDRAYISVYNVELAVQSYEKIASLPSRPPALPLPSRTKH